MHDPDSKNVNIFYSRDRLEEELELNIVYHCMLSSFRALYGQTKTIQWHYGNKPGSAPTIFHISREGLRQEDAPSTVYFNVLAAKVYKKQLQKLMDTATLFTVSNDVKFVTPS